jgi:hypothetical protein
MASSLPLRPPGVHILLWGGYRFLHLNELHKSTTASRLYQMQDSRPEPYFVLSKPSAGQTGKSRCEAHAVPARDATFSFGHLCPSLDGPSCRIGKNLFSDSWWAGRLPAAVLANARNEVDRLAGSGQSSVTRRGQAWGKLHAALQSFEGLPRAYFRERLTKSLDRRC